MSEYTIAESIDARNNYPVVRTHWLTKAEGTYRQEVEKHVGNLVRF